jgi:hypothetical protein
MKVIQKVVKRVILLVKSVKQLNIYFDYKSLEISQFLDGHIIRTREIKDRGQ